MTDIKKRILSIFLILCMVNISLFIVNAEDAVTEETNVLETAETENAGSILFAENFAEGLSNWKISGGDKDKATIVNSISGNMLFLNQLNAGSTCEAIANGDFMDFAMETEFRYVNGSYFGWFFRYESGYKTYLLQYYSSSKEFKLLRGNGISFEELASKVVRMESDTIHVMRISAIESDIKAYLNGEEIFNIKDDGYKGGKVGFRALNADVYFGNIVVATDEQTLETSNLSIGSDGKLLIEDFEDGAAGWKFTQNPSAFSIEKVYDASVLKFQNLNNMLEAGTMLYGNNAWKDYSVEFELTPVVSGSAGILFCYQDAGKHYLLQFYGTNKVRLLKKANDYSYKVLATAMCNLKKNEANKVAINIEGNNIKISVGEKKLINTSDNALKAGKIGIRGMYSVFYVDNIKVTN